MVKVLNKHKRFSFISKLLCSSFCFFILLSCTSTPKTSLHSKNLSFKIQWDYSSLSTNEKSSFLSFVFIQEDRLLRLDIFQPLVGVLGSLILNSDIMILQVPMKKSYYQGEFNSKVFFPDFPSFPSSWLFALLRGQTLKSWDCQKQDKKVTRCKAGYFEIQWKYKKGQLYKIFFKDSKQRQIKAQIKNISSKEFPSRLFDPSLKNLKKQKNPLFFQKF